MIKILVLDGLRESSLFTELRGEGTSEGVENFGQPEKREQRFWTCHEGRAKVLDTLSKGNKNFSLDLS